MSADLPLLLLLLLCFLVAVVLAAAETSLIRISRVRVTALAEAGSHRARRLLRLLENLPRVVNAILLTVLLVQIGAAAITGLLAQRWFGNVGVTLATVVLTLVLFVYSEAIPKTFAVRYPDRVALALSYPVRILEALLRPVVSGLVWFADLQAPGKGIATSPTVTERELLLLAGEAARQGEITGSDLQLMERAFRLGDRTAEEVMVPRLDVVSVSVGASVDEAVDKALRAGHRRLLVYDGDLDQVVGVLHLRTLVRAAGQEPPATVADLTQTPLVVPESKRVVELLREMQEGGSHFAVVVDEYGGTAGIVTIEDIVEEVLGAVADEGEAPIEFARRLSGERWLVDGRMLVDDLGELLNVDLPEGDWTTVAGLVMGLAGEVLRTGDEVSAAGYRFRVAGATRHRIHRLEVTRERPPRGERAR